MASRSPLTCIYPDNPVTKRRARSEPIDDVLVVDHAADGRPIGIEILDPKAVSVGKLNQVLRGLNQAEIEDSELTPLQVA